MGCGGHSCLPATSAEFGINSYSRPLGPLRPEGIHKTPASGPSRSRTSPGPRRGSFPSHGQCPRLSLPLTCSELEDGMGVRVEGVTYSATSLLCFASTCHSPRQAPVTPAFKHPDPYLRPSLPGSGPVALPVPTNVVRLKAWPCQASCLRNRGLLLVQKKRHLLA